MSDPAELVDLERYPLTTPDAPLRRQVVAAARRGLAEKGVAILPGFVRPEPLRLMAEEAAALKARAHLEDVWGTPYLTLPDESYPEGHPRRTSVHSLTWVIAYDLIPPHSPLRALYEWEALMDFAGEILERSPIFRMADPLGALNYTIMDEGHTQCWHYDNADFVVSLAIQSSRAGGDFECAPFIRSDADESYDDVARVLAGEGQGLLEVFPMTPGTLMVFAGRCSLHRVSPVRGRVPRQVALLAYDTRPDTDSSELFKLVRYGRSTSPPPAG